MLAQRKPRIGRRGRVSPIGKVPRSSDVRYISTLADVPEGAQRMARDYEMLSTSRQSALLSDVVLRETATTRLIARPEIVENDNAPEAGVRITFIHQRRSMNAPWSDIPSDSLGALKAGEGFR